jgi:hypothetical protein
MVSAQDGPDTANILTHPSHVVTQRLYSDYTLLTSLMQVLWGVSDCCRQAEYKDGFMWELSGSYWDMVWCSHGQDGEVPAGNTAHVAGLGPFKNSTLLPCTHPDLLLLLLCLAALLKHRKVVVLGAHMCAPQCVLRRDAAGGLHDAGAQGSMAPGGGRAQRATST